MKKISKGGIGMKKEKISLLRDVFKVYTLKKGSKTNIINDERVISENNKIMNVTFNILVCVLVLVLIITDTINVKINSNVIFACIGIVTYIGLILMCKKNAIEGNEYSVPFFLWSIFTLPITTFNSMFDILYRIINNDVFILVDLFISIMIVVVLYNIANFIYKKSSKSK